jgi:hypothetical protein
VCAYLGLVALVNCWREWLREGPERERKVDERVLELLQLLVALHQLVELQAHKTFGWVARRYGVSRHSGRTHDTHKAGDLPVIMAVVVAMAGMILPAICLVLCTSASLME